MQAAAAATRRRRLRQGLGLVVYRRRAAPQAAGDSAKTEAAADHGEAAARLPYRAGGARRIPNRTANPDRRAVARYVRPPSTYSALNVPWENRSDDRENRDFSED